MIKNNERTTHNIVQRGDSFRIRHSVSVSAIVTVDSDAFSKPHRHHIVKRYAQAVGYNQQDKKNIRLYEIFTIIVVYFKLL